MELKCIVILLFCIGFGYGWQPGLRYTYIYSGSVSVGLQEISQQAAITVIQAKVIIQVEKTDDGSAIVQFEDIFIGERNAKGKCNNDIDVEYRPYICPCLLETFRIFIQKDAKVVMEQKSGTDLWRTNLKKAIVSSFVNEVMRGNFPTDVESSYNIISKDKKLLNVFSVQEETILGECQVDYHLHKLPEYLSVSKLYQLGETIEEDVQNPGSPSPYTKKTSTKKTSSKSKYRKTSRIKTTKSGRPQPLVDTPQIENNLYRLVRTVEFDNCINRVEMQQIPVGMHGQLGASQYEWLRSRSSSSEYLLRGSPGAFRVEEIFVEGTVTLAPIGIKTDLMQSRTNQTFKLISVKTSDATVKGPSQPDFVTTWLQEVQSTYPKPSSNQDSLKWVQHVDKSFPFTSIETFLGPDVATGDAASIKHEVLRLIEEVSVSLTDLDQKESPKPGSDVSKLEKASMLMSYLNKDDILKILRLFAADVKDDDLEKSSAFSLAVDIASTIHPKSGIEAILELSKEKEMDAKVATVFMTLSSNSGTPEVLPILMDYVLQLDLQNKPFSTSIIWLNFANFVKKFCYSEHPSKMKYFGQVMGDTRCDKSLITERFIPHLQGIIEKEYISAWAKVASVLVLQTIGSPLSIPILIPVILGHGHTHMKLRTSAIYGLEAFKLPHYVKPQVMDILTNLYYNIGEETEIRQSALATIISWNPPPSFLHQLAKSTWREPSKQMVSFVTSTLHSLADTTDPNLTKMSQAAYHASKFVKPGNFGSDYSTNYMKSGNIEELFIKKFANAAWLRDAKDLWFDQLYYFVITRIGGFQMINLEAWLSSQGLGSLLVEYALKGEINTLQGDDLMKRVAKLKYDDIRDVVLTKENFEGYSIPEAHVWFRLLENSFIYAPLSGETFQTLPIASRDSLALLAVKLSMGYDLSVGKFANPIDLVSFLPTEIGMPLITKLSVPMVMSAASFLTLQPPSSPLASLFPMGLSSELLVRISSKAEARIEVLIPWQKTSISTGVTSIRDIVVPLDVKIKLDEKNNDHVGLHHKVLIDTECSYKKKFTAFHACNTPFTEIRSIHLLEAHGEGSRLPVSNNVRENTMALPAHMSHFTGLNFEMTWKSDFKSPFNIMTLMDMGAKSEGTPWILYILGSTTSRLWSLDVSFDPSTSSTERVEFEISTGTFVKKEEDEGQSTGQFSQYDQEPDEYEQVMSQKQSNLFDSNTQIFTFSGTDAEVITDELPWKGQQSNSDEEIYTTETDGSSTGIKPASSSWEQTLQERADALMTIYGTSVSHNNLKLTFISDKDEDITYELVLVTSNSFNRVTKRKLSKSQLVYFRSALPKIGMDKLSVCVDRNSATPIISKMDTLETIVGKDLNTHANIKMRLGCTQNPILSLSTSYKVSTETLRNWKTSVMENMCNHDKYDPMVTFINTASYDSYNVSLKWDKICNRKNYPTVTSVVEFLDDLKISPCDLNAELPAKLDLSVNKNQETNTWNMNLRRGQFTLLSHEDFENNDDYNLLASIGFAAEPVEYASRFYDEGGESHNCVIGSDFVRTFDGLVYKFQPTECWTILVTESSYGDNFMILVRSPPEGTTSISEIRLIDLNRGLVADIARGDIKVNGNVINFIGEKEVQKSPDGEVIYIAKKISNQKGASYHFKIPNMVTITVKDNVEINIDDRYYNAVDGLCGNRNTEIYDDMVSPQQCYYGDPSKFAASWTGPSDSCDIYKILSLRKGIDELENKCTSRSSPTFRATYEESCLHYSWEILPLANLTNRHEEFLCITSGPTPRCDTSPHCHKLDETYIQEELRCWTYSTLPQSIAKAIDSGDTSLLYSIEGETRFREYIHVPRSCIKTHFK